MLGLGSAIILLPKKSKLLRLLSLIWKILSNFCILHFGEIAQTFAMYFGVPEKNYIWSIYPLLTTLPERRPYEGLYESLVSLKAGY